MNSFTPRPNTSSRRQIAHAAFTFIGPFRYLLISRPFIEVILRNGGAGERAVRDGRSVGSR